MIVGITGLHRDVNGALQTIGAGKDAAAEALIAKHNFVRIGLADPLKRICMEVFDFSVDQLWGPSDMRNAPDFRYPRSGKLAKESRDKCEQARIEYSERYKTEKPDSREMLKLKSDIAVFSSWGWLTPRHALQQLGTEWGRECYDLTWIDYGLRAAKTLLQDAYTAYTAKDGLIPRIEQTSQGEFEIDNWPKPLKGVVFSDIRFFNEYKAIKAAGGKLVRVKRFSWQPFPGHIDTAHESEMQLSGYADDQFDYIIDNGGDLNHLQLLVDRMMDVLNKRIIPYDEAQTDIPPGLRGLGPIA